MARFVEIGGNYVNPDNVFRVFDDCGYTVIVSIGGERFTVDMSAKEVARLLAWVCW